MNPFNTILVKTIPLLPKKLVRVFANKYIAGDSIEDAVRTVKNLNSGNVMATVDVLGESIKDRGEAVKSKNESLEVLDTIVKHNLNGNLSVKLTMLALAMDYELCKKSVHRNTRRRKEQKYICTNRYGRFFRYGYYD